MARDQQSDGNRDNYRDNDDLRDSTARPEEKRLPRADWDPFAEDLDLRVEQPLS